MNKKVKFIYNPYSGEQTIVGKLDEIITMHQKKNLTIVPYRITKGEAVEKALEDIDQSYEYILLAGGDGTIDSVVNAIKKKEIDLPIGILPVGTANDFAKLLGLPANVEECLNQILELKARDVDLGKVNDKYFINVLSTGLFTDISQKTEAHFLKNAIGKLAYYIKGIEELHNVRKIKIKVTTKDKVYDDPSYLMLVFNGRTAGNFNLATEAEFDDGLLDVIIFKAFNIPEIVPIFIRVLKGEHLEDSRIEYFKTDRLLIETNEDIVSDIDGEKGPDFPLEVKCIKKAIKVLGIK
ncbi:MAG: YegS/Rv2252/BmrU family lipid kinase [Sarcina sp.]